jgi:hypothetical protein
MQTKAAEEKVTDLIEGLATFLLADWKEASNPTQR